MDLTFLLQLGGLLLTLAILLYMVVGDNFIFRLVTYTFIGVASGYVFILVIFQVLGPRLISLFTTGNLLFLVLGLIPFLLGILLLLKLLPGLHGMATVPLGILTGIGAAVAIGGAVFGTLFGQIDGTLAPIPSLAELLGAPADGQVASPVARLTQGLITILGIITTLAYFQFSVRSRNTTPNVEEGTTTTARRAVSLEFLAKIGQVFIGITLGAVFAGVYTAAISALVERIGFILDVVATLMTRFF